MQYRFATNQNYEDYAGGRFFYSAPGYTAFPVRLMSEIWQRCLVFRQQQGQTNPCVLYDPCCGGAYHLAVLAYMHWQSISQIIGSDADTNALELAGRNLALLQSSGLEKRISEIADMKTRFQKQSHQEAFTAALRFKKNLADLIINKPIATHLFQANALESNGIGAGLANTAVDIVFSDVPYGRQAEWVLPEAVRQSEQSPVWHLLEALRPHLNSDTIVALAANKKEKINHLEYKRLERFQVGKRRITLLHLS